MNKNWRYLALAAGLGFLSPGRALAQKDLSEHWDRLRKSQLPGMSESGASKKPRQLPAGNSGDRKFAVNVGSTKRHWLGQSGRLDLGMLDSDYQAGISFFLRDLGEFEIDIAGFKSAGRKEYFRNETDRDNLILWGPFLFLGDLPVKMNYTEDIKLMDFQLHYWHNIAGSKEESFQIGAGTHLYVLEKHTKIRAQYEDYGPDVLILNPHYQSSESHSTNLIPGFSLGARGKLDLTGNFRNSAYYLGSISVSLGYVWAKPTAGVSIGGEPVNKLNNLNAVVQYGYAF